MFYKKLQTLAFVRTFVFTISSSETFLENLLSQVSNDISLLKVTYNINDFAVQDLVTSVLMQRSGKPFSVDTANPLSFYGNFLDLIFAEDFEDFL